MTLLLAGALGTHSAHAGLYVMRNCDVPGRGYSSIGSWRTIEMASGIAMTNRCASGGGIAFEFTGSRLVPAGAGPMLALARPTSGAQSEIKFIKATVWYAARLAGTGGPLHFHSLYFDAARDYHLGVSNGPPGAENLVLEQQFSPIDTTLYKIGLSCGLPTGPSGADCLAADNVPLQIRGMEVTLSEDSQPIVSQTGGTVLEGGHQSGIRTLTYSVFDRQSGLTKVDVLLGDAVVASRDLTARCTYDDFTVCTQSDDATLAVDTRAVPNGTHPLTLRVYDAATNERVVNVANAVDVRNEIDLDGPATLAARFAGSTRATLTAPFSRRVSIRGQLTGASPLGRDGAQIDVLTQTDRRGAREVVTGRVRTRADGTFSYVLPRSQPSRAIRLAYRPHGPGGAASPRLRLRVRAASNLRASLRGRIIRFSGRVLSRPLPQAGKRVMMEGRAPGFAWSVFRSLRTDRKGRFRGKYRLPIRRPGVKLEVRAVIPTENGYPYLRYRTRAVRLRVR